MVGAAVAVCVVLGADAIIGLQQKSLVLRVVLTFFSRKWRSKMFRRLASMSMRISASAHGLIEPEKSRNEEKVRLCGSASPLT